MSTNTTDGPDDRPIRYERHADLMAAHEHDEEQDRLAGDQAPVTNNEQDVIIEAAIDEFFATDFAEGIDWVGTGTFRPSEVQQRAEVRTVVEAVLAPSLTLLAEQTATIERVRGLCAVMVRQHHSDTVQVSDVMRELDAP